MVVSFCFDKAFLNSQRVFQFEHDVEYTLALHAAADRLNYTIAEHLKERTVEEAIGATFFSVMGGDGHIRMEGGLHELRVKNQDLHESVFSNFRDEYTYPEVAAVRKAIEQIFVYESLDFSPYSKIRRPVVASAASVLKEDGSNLAQVLNTLKNNHRVSYQKISSALQAINPAFEEISFNLLGGNMELMLGEQGLYRAIHARHISDGTLKFLCVLCLLHNPALHHSVLAIDELENALHPDMQHYLMAELTQQKHTQFIVATHSPLLVDGAQPQQLRIVEKDEQNASVIKIPGPSTEEWLETYTTGRLWLEGHLGGTRY